MWSRGEHHPFIRTDAAGQSDEHLAVGVDDLAQATAAGSGGVGDRVEGDAFDESSGGAGSAVGVAFAQHALGQAQGLLRAVIAEGGLSFEQGLIGGAADATQGG